MITPKKLKQIIAMLPKGCNPRIGGSYNLYLRGLVNSYRDIDVIVDTIDGINLPFPKIELIHKKRLNRTVKYCIEGQEIDFSESLFPDKSYEYCKIMDIDFAPAEEVQEARRMLDEFIANYKED